MATETGAEDVNDLTIIQVPEYFYAVDINYLTHMIADMLSRLMSHNDRIPLTPSNLTRFHSRTPPNISLGDYLRRIVKYASVEKACLLILLIYIDRVCELHPSFTVSSLTVHRFLITAVTVSSKAICDSYCTNSHYAKVGGISTHELNALELEFLRLINWNLASSGLTLQQYYVNLVAQHPCYQRIRSQTKSKPSSSSAAAATAASPPSSSEAPTEEAAEAATAVSSSALPSTPDTTHAEAPLSPSLLPAMSGSKRRRSSTIAELMSTATHHHKHPSQDPNTMPATSYALEADEEDQVETARHFDALLEHDSIPYIA
ncbi:cyclin-domain-containing protein [Syncephalastrum racemosum]|uniref:Cyclin-domain-containing protein n=1 Tax=Syncephalastrum racemosum TaxID=13706 RepID=A0A1X2GZN3_SYNRA|nr:cyclin-domain-containing protein [Syncephalastrum racemosum]